MLAALVVVAGDRSGPAAGRVAGGATGLRGRQESLVVQVLSRGCGGIALGSGVVVPGGRVLTNRHVVAGADYVEVRREDGVRIGARIESVARDVDLALLWAGPLVGGGAEPRGRLRPRQAVSVLGHPGGGPAVRATGPVTARIGFDGDGTDAGVAWVDVAVAAGNSGGPAFAAGGDLVGVVFAREANTGLAGVIDGDTAATFLAGGLPAVGRTACEDDPRTG
jgi:S1-C subfamily serine protease